MFLTLGSCLLCVLKPCLLLRDKQNYIIMMIDQLPPPSLFLLHHTLTHLEKDNNHCTVVVSCSHLGVILRCMNSIVHWIASM